ncbi:HNH endonuclease, partial [Paenarthrobacter ureafaciens]
MSSSVAGAGSVLDDGYRNAAEFLRARLRIDIREARRRLTQAALLLPGTTLTGETTTPRHEHLATAFAATDVPSRSATIITTALERVAF